MFLKLTDVEKRDIFHQAAAWIEANPGGYSFLDKDRNMWAAVRSALGFGPDIWLKEIAEGVFGLSGQRSLYEFNQWAQEGRPYVHSATAAADHLRTFADHHWGPPGATSMPKPPFFTIRRV